METILQHSISDDILFLEQKEREEAFEKVKNLRWIVLLISCFMIFGGYYAYDTPYAVKFYLRKSYSDYSRTDFNYMFATLYAVYDFPNIILPLINGYLASKVGIKKMMTFFIFFITIGVIIVTVGVYTVSFPTLLAGRVLYGLGGDSLLVTQWVYIAEFFNEDKIGVASGFITMFSGISESANLFFSPKLASSYGLGAPFVFTTILCLCGFIARILLNCIDHKIRKHIPQVASLSLESLVPVRNSLFPSREDLHFPKSFYLVLWFGITTSVSYYGFYYLAYDFLDSTWFAHLSLIKAQNEASIYTSISSALKTLGVVLLGYLADRYKLYIHYAIAAPIILTISYMLALKIPPLVPFLLFGFGGALSQISLWTCLSFAVNEKKILVGAAVMYSLMNGLFATIQYINTFFYQINQNYDPAIYFFCGLNLFAVIGALKFYRYMSNKHVQ